MDLSTNLGEQLSLDAVSFGSFAESLSRFFLSYGASTVRLRRVDGVSTARLRRVYGVSTACSHGAASFTKGNGPLSVAIAALGSNNFITDALLCWIHTKGDQISCLGGPYV